MQKKVTTHLLAFAAGILLTILGGALLQNRNLNRWTEASSIVRDYIEAKVAGKEVKEIEEVLDGEVDFSDFTREYSTISTDTWGKEYFFSILFENGKVYWFETRHFGSKNLALSVSPNARHIQPEVATP